MKKFTGLILALAGGGATIWGGISVLIGNSNARLEIVPDFAPTALMVGLVGVALLTVGLVWARD